MGVWRRLFGRGERDALAPLYRAVVAEARRPDWYRQGRVPDTLDGRFDMVTLHGWMALERLKAAGMDAEAQALTDTLFISFDEALREQGTGDMGMGRRMKAIANAFFGRLTAYSGAREKAVLAEALAKNVWRGAAVDTNALLLADYVTGARASLGRSDLASGRLDFGPLPDEKGGQ